MMKSKPKSAAMMMPQGYKDGGKVKAFNGKDTKAEEMAEAKQVRSGKVSAAQYKSKEMAEEKREGEKSNPAKLMATGKALASGKMTAQQYGASAKMANGGYVGGCVDMPSMAGNSPSTAMGQRSQQDYKK
jgi:hypothetical protein